MAAKLHMAESASSERIGTKIYIVQMAADPAMRYQGGLPASPRRRRRRASATTRARARSRCTRSIAWPQQDALLAKIGASSGKIYSYRHALNGFAARMTARQAASLRKDKSVRASGKTRRWRSTPTIRRRFLGLLDERGRPARQAGLRGRNVIIGMIDSGIVQEHPSLDGTGYGPPPSRWTGTCQAGEGFAADDCNNKLIGARYFIEGFGADGHR